MLELKNIFREILPFFYRKQTISVANILNNHLKHINPLQPKVAIR